MKKIKLASLLIILFTIIDRFFISEKQYELKWYDVGRF